MLYLERGREKKKRREGKIREKREKEEEKRRGGCTAIINAERVKRNVS